MPFLSIFCACIILYFMDKQKSYGENYQQVNLKHRLSKKFFFVTGAVCLFAAVCIVIVSQIV